jgi:hypothetical protein
MSLDARDFPQAYYCMITQQLMVDPVTDHEGNSYERSAIEQWLATHDTSPVTRAPLRRSDLRENLAIRDSIRQIQEARSRQAQAASSIPTPAAASMSLADTGNIEFFISSCNSGGQNEKLVMIESSHPEGTKRTPVMILTISVL